MTPERLREVERLFHEARERPPAERDTFLARACAGDLALRREVESLLAQPPAGLIDAPVGALVAGLVVPASVLLPGRRLGVFEVQGLLGVGGMGEVYRARDTRLGREVAIKILPRAFKDDPDRLARFEREARVLASLNHPHIGAIYGLEEADDITALVMELVDGDDLSQRVGRGAIPIAEALPIARQIAEALEAAHEQGIIHRDLKPGNIKVRPDGTVKVLDFGLAKALDPTSASGAEMMNSPTLTPRATVMGTIIGTAAYMAPEQARGKAVDRRADIWAFGVVVYEMLTGQRPFDGDDISVTLASVLKDNVSWQALPADLPSPVRRMLRRCLERDPRRRLSAMGDARLELDDAGTSADRDGVLGPTLLAAVAPTLLRRALPWAVAGIFGVALISSLVMWSPWRPAPVPTPRKLLASIGADASLPTDVGSSAILSPDGTMFAFIGQRADQTRLFTRKLDQLQAAALAGTDGAASPFFSPDGQWIAFFAGGKLKKVSTTGGVPVTLCDAPAGRGGTWTDDDTIIFTPASTPDTKLVRVSAAGGTPVVFGTLSEGTMQRWPQALPGGKAVLYTESSTGTWDGANLVVGPLSNGTPKVVVRGGYYGRYVPSGLASSRPEREGGHLVYMQQGTLFAVRFDRDRLETIGQPVPALEGIAANGVGGAQVALSSEGTLVYVPGTAPAAANPIEWMTRDGKTSVLRAAKADWANPRFSPDGQKLALDISDGKQSDIWVYDLARDTLTQLTFDTGDDRIPVWSPDSQHIAFASDRAKAGVFNVYWVNADGTGDVTRLTESPETQLPWSWHPTGAFIAFFAIRSGTQRDLMILPMNGDAARGWKGGKPTVFLGTPAGNMSPTFSPDGRWIAYFSNEAGGTYNDVYVRPFPGPGGKWRVSTEGGSLPRWSTTAHELLFLSNQDKVMFAPYTVVGDSFRADKPQIWSPTVIRGARLGARFTNSSNSNSGYDLHPDGKRLAVVAAQEQSSVQDKVVFVSNFSDYLRTIAPGKP